MDRYERFEHTLPFYRMRIDVFEGRVKRFVNNKNSVTIDQLRYAFKNEKNWEDLQHNDGILFKLINSEEFRDEENPEEINIHTLLLWGVLNCDGDNKLKARVFYDILQDSL